MKNYLETNKKAGVVSAVLAGGIIFSSLAMANHTVLVEGEQDFDGDGITGAAEDTDGDQVFGTIMGGVSGVSDNGRVMIVTSGRFFESVTLAGNGVTALEAAPGVNAVIEAFNGGGDVDANNSRQMTHGILVDSDGSFPIEIRNIVSRNWTTGIAVTGGSRVTIDDVRLDSNVNYGVLAMGSSRVAVVNSQVNGTGYRRSGSLGATPGGDIAPQPGVGIEFEDNSSGYISGTTIAHSFAAGIRSNGRVTRTNNILFDNNADASSMSDCVDSDGDGFGWDGSATCIP